jgi:hypothetical protein
MRDLDAIVESAGRGVLIRTETLALVSEARRLREDDAKLRALLIRLGEVLTVLMAGVSVGLDEPPTVTHG